MAGPDANARGGRSAIYSVELEVFEGPLDLLLHLVRRHELEILDIPIAFITEKYLEYLDFMRSLDLEVAGDYLVMAATLAWLKSRELLPTDPLPTEAGDGDDEDGEDPREALIRRLVEYERFKNAAADLDSLPVSGRDVFARGADIDIPPVDPGLAPVTLFRLAEAYYKVLTRAKINKSHDVQLEPVTVAQRMTQLTLLLDQKQAFDFEGLFLGRTWSSERELRTMLVVTLMSVLELVKLGVAGVQQVPETDAIRIYRLNASDEARALIDAYDEEASFGDAGRPPPPPPPPTEAELDAAEESALLAEALAGADDTDLGPDAGTSPAANAPLAPDTELADPASTHAAVDETAEPAAEEREAAEPEAEAEELDAAEPETDAEELDAAEPETEELDAAESEMTAEELDAAEPETTVEELDAAEPETTVEELDAAEPETDAEKLDATEPEMTAEELDATESELTVEELDAAEPETTAEEAAGHETTVDELGATASETTAEELDATEPETTAEELDVAKLETTVDELDAAKPETTADEVEAAEPETTADELEATEHETPADEVEAAERETPADELEATEHESPADEVEATERETTVDELEATERETPADDHEATEHETSDHELEATEHETTADDHEAAEPETPADDHEAAEPETPAFDHDATELEATADEVEHEATVASPGLTDPVERDATDLDTAHAAHAPIAREPARDALDARETTESGPEPADTAAHASTDDPGTADPGQEDEA